MTAPPARRIDSLDLLRFLAALAVVAYHYTVKGTPKSGVGAEEVAFLTKYGGFGVDLFFVVSGFVILLSARGRTPREFIISRLSRIVPAFLVCCLLTYAVVNAFGPASMRSSPGDLLANLSLIAITPVGRVLGVNLVDGVYWTLAIETQFYLFVWLALVFGALKHTRALLWGWLGASAAVQALALTVGMSTPVKLLGEAVLYDWSAYFIAGGFFYLAFSGDRRRSDVAALLACFGMSALQSVERAAYLNQHDGMGLTVLGVVITVGLIYGVFALLSYTRFTFGPLLRWSWLGNATYPLYLLHAYLGYTLFTLLKGTMPDPLLVVLVAGLFIALALAVHRYVERPVNAWVKKRTRKPGTVPTAA
ncbi:acyltransferase family protein [Deinococcus sp. UR1]|uniref:acyltransferase family protein n=1 Tax=Deinococcus sp. UR1 TaxID=1704277 RepID=UPI0006DBFC28|nr:acyltransferase [Deinococcus sp. UR1]